jgi:hypothetical protein
MSSPVYAAVAVSVVFLIPVSVQAQSLASVPQPPVAVSPSDDPLALDGVAPQTAATYQSKLDEPIDQIAGTAHGCAILDKDFPGLRSHPMYGFFKNMSLHQIAAMSRGRITTDMLSQAQTDLAAQPSSAATISVSAR